MADTVLTELKIHDFDTLEQYLQHESGIGDNDIVFTPDMSAKLFLFKHDWADYLVSDMSWLRADTFSWHSGDVYKTAYEHLAGDLVGAEYKIYYAWVSASGSVYYSDIENVTNGRLLYFYDNGEFTSDPYIYFTVSDGVVSTSGGIVVTRDASKDRSIIVNSNDDTVGDITITYYLAQDGHKICLPDQESNLVALYESTGAANYYLLDTTNKQFKLPRKQKRKLIQAVKNGGTWYNLYSDGWVEQGGRGETNVSVTLPVAMTDSNYVVLVENHVRVNGGTGASDMTTTSFIPRWQQYNASGWGTGNHDVSWQVSGYAAESEYASAGMRLEYYYVGNFEQSAIEQTAGLNAELFNNKADRDLGNIPTNYDYVVESQMPTAENGYTWYRKYKSGWVEQGGHYTHNNVQGAVTTTLVIAMADTHYNLQITKEGGSSGNAQAYYEYMSIYNANSKTTTSFQVQMTGANRLNGYDWQVSGMSAQ